MINLDSLYVGIKAENISVLKKCINIIFDHHQNLREQMFASDSFGVKVNQNHELLEKELKKMLDKMEGDIPFFHPRYLAQMIKDPSLPSIIGLFSYLLTNPNNHAFEGGPITTQLEKEVELQFLSYLGFRNGWGHLTSGGTAANLEAIWLGRTSQGGKGRVLFSDASHFAWPRLCQVTNAPFEIIRTDRNFRMDLDQVKKMLAQQKVDLIVANLGSTGTGSVDNIEELVKLKKDYDFHLHIDGAYGGFSRCLIIDGQNLEKTKPNYLSSYVDIQLRSIPSADSVTIDPHKHGQVSYGAGAVFYRDEQLKKKILHSAPYTYNHPDRPNIGMYCLEGSRPGAMAAACYLTFKLFPLNDSGIGQVLDLTFRSSRKLYKLIDESKKYNNLLVPDLDINCFYKIPTTNTIEEMNEINLAVYGKFSVTNPESQFYLSKFHLNEDMTKQIFEDYNLHREGCNVLRAVLMKHFLAYNDFEYLKKLIVELERA